MKFCRVLVGTVSVFQLSCSPPPKFVTDYVNKTKGFVIALYATQLITAFIRTAV